MSDRRHHGPSRRRWLRPVHAIWLITISLTLGVGTLLWLAGLPWVRAAGGGLLAGTLAAIWMIAPFWLALWRDLRWMRREIRRLDAEIADLERKQARESRSERGPDGP